MLLHKSPLRKTIFCILIAIEIGAALFVFPKRIRPLRMDTVDHSVRFAYRAAFVASAFERFVCDFTPQLAQLSFGQLVVPKGIGII